MPGEWTVQIVNQDGEALEAHTLIFAPKQAGLAAS
jgi:hypothetical protein